MHFQLTFVYGVRWGANLILSRVPGQFSWLSVEGTTLETIKVEWEWLKTQMNGKTSMSTGWKTFVFEIWAVYRFSAVRIKIPMMLFPEVEAIPKIYMEPRKHPDWPKKSWERAKLEASTSWFQNTPQRDSNRNSVVLVRGQTWRRMEEGRGSKPPLQSTDQQQVAGNTQGEG